MRWAKRRCAGHHRRSGWHHHGPRLLLQCEHNRTRLHGSEVNHRLFSATISYFSFAFFFFYNFVMSSSVVSVEDHQQTFRSHPMRVLRLHQILSLSELMDGRSCRRAGPFPLVVWTHDRRQQCFSRFHGFSIRFHRGGPLAGTLLWSLHWQAGVARQREQLLSCPAVHAHRNRCTWMSLLIWMLLFLCDWNVVKSASRPGVFG